MMNLRAGNFPVLVLPGVRRAGRRVLLAMLVFCAGGCGPKPAPESKRRTVDGHFARAIAGQVPGHGSVYSSRELEIMHARVTRNPKDIVARQSMTEALTRLGRIEEALVELDALERVRPGRFETHYQRALALNASGNLQAALDAARTALTQRQSGHDDMGDYFLRMLEWRAARGKGEAVHENFLGISHDAPPEALASDPRFNQRQLVALLEVFPDFLDGHLVLGDWLTSQNNDQLAMRAYLRALKTPAEADRKRIARRLSRLEAKWAAKAQAADDYVFDEAYRERIEQEFDDAAAWRTQFEMTEQELVRELPGPPALAPDDADAATRDAALAARTRALAEQELPGIDSVLQEMQRRGIEGPAYYHAGLLPARPSPWGFLTGGSPLLWAGAAIAVALLIVLYRRVSGERWRRRYKL